MVQADAGPRPALSRALLTPGPLPPLSPLGATLLEHAASAWKGSGGGVRHIDRWDLTTGKPDPLKLEEESDEVVSLADGLRLENDLSTLLRTTEDREEGARAFVEKRKPRWSGR